MRLQIRARGPPAGVDLISDSTVRSVIDALQARDRERWFGLFSEGAKFSDDGIPSDLEEWCEDELFGSAQAYLTSIDRVEDGGLTFYARYHSDKWGDFKTFWRFVLEEGKVGRLDVVATSY